MKRLYILFLILGLAAMGCGSGKSKDRARKPGNTKVELHDSMVVSVLTTPPGSETAANGTGSW